MEHVAVENVSIFFFLFNLPPWQFPRYSQMGCFNYSVGHQSGIHGILVKVRVRWTLLGRVQQRLGLFYDSHHTYNSIFYVLPSNCHCFDLWPSSRFSPLDLFIQLGTSISCLSCISSPLFCLTTLHCPDPLLTLHLLCDPRWTPWRLLERRSVGWRAAHMMPSTPMLPFLLVRLNASVYVKLTIYLSAF